MAQAIKICTENIKNQNLYPLDRNKPINSNIVAAKHTVKKLLHSY